MCADGHKVVVIRLYIRTFERPAVWTTYYVLNKTPITIKSGNTHCTHPRLQINLHIVRQYSQTHSTRSLFIALHNKCILHIKVHSYMQVWYSKFVYCWVEKLTYIRTCARSAEYTCTCPTNIIYSLLFAEFVYCACVQCGAE